MLCTFIISKIEFLDVIILAISSLQCYGTYLISYIVYLFETLLGLLDLLLRQETASISYYLRVLFRMYAETVKDKEQRVAIAEPRLIKYVMN